jgi:BirA family biotin operon repressor/biotin-[acetyl-CoA-carboxylase] ligase
LQNSIFPTLFIGQSLVKLSEVDSTNTYLKDLVSKSKPLMDGTVIMADHQFAGRGQNENIWYSQAGLNLTCSIYLKSSFLAVNEQFFLNMAVCLGITDCLITLLNNDCSIKWPNDIFYKNRKLGGILIENITKGYQLKESIIGIGLNINQTDFGDLENNATSIAKILHQNYDITNLLIQICAAIEKRYLQLKSGQKTILAADYQKRLFLLHQTSMFEINNKVVEGEILGVATEGYLMMKIDGESYEFDLKEVKFIV